ncbi:hypothetical protein H6P81_013981 [Aristolochia fimbriata]|uniref:5'-3' DNA helicase ZGRF1-like N-terminal domain-containing protein n=1 Tax=Aristolochia fimbriata TaxID=158543 RepID=A0AAV7EGF4_ARIFI|nr:hypothetical protein H6P81_013981 [Aristolochia fimbriata]
MENTRRWIVTYTKHLTQKRKIYKDGVLELHGHNEKVVLFDDCGEVLDSRFLKKSEVVESGGTVAFAAYLVDVAECEAESKAIRESECEIRRNESTRKTWTKTGKMARYNVPSDNKVCASFPAVAQRNRLISMGNYAKGNKEADSLNSEVAQSHPSTTGTTTKEWNALFTTQLTQKAKKYHDGILKLSFRGFYQKQVMLYDDSGKHLTSKFLKKDEVIESGGSVTFDGYLVEIGNVKESITHLDDLGNKGQNKDTFTDSCMNKQLAEGKHENRSRTVAAAENKLIFLEDGIKGKSESRSQPLASPETDLNSTEDNITEWHAMYTAQVTQKGKKYHDGIIKVSSHGSHSRQVSLLTEDRTPLVTVHMQSLEKLRCGTTLHLANYLVEISNPQTSQRGELQIGASSAKIVALDDSDSSAKNLMMNELLDINKSVRDVRQILGVLKRPKVEENLAPRELMEVRTTPSACEDLIQSNDLESGGTSFRKESEIFLSTTEDNSGVDSQISAFGIRFPLVKFDEEIYSAGVTNCYHDSCEEKFFTATQSNTVTPGSRRFPAANTQEYSTKQSGNTGAITSENQEKPDQVQDNAGDLGIGPLGYEEATPSNLNNLLEFDPINSTVESAAELKRDGNSMDMVMDDIPGFDLGF